MIPITILTGFLGSGKTTLINKIIKKNPDIRFGLIINEFGEIGVDGQIIDGNTEEKLEISDGCVCCVVRGDLVQAIEKMAMSEKVDYILLETSGLAEPAPVIQTFMTINPEVVRLDSFMTLLDAENYDSLNKEYKNIDEQIKLADVVVLNKIEGLAPEKIIELQSTIATLNPYATIIENTSDTPANLFIESGKWSMDRLLELGLSSKEEKHELNHSEDEIHHHDEKECTNPDHHHGHSHEHHHTHDDVDEVVYRTMDVLDPNKLDSWLYNLFPKNVIRSKGILRIKTPTGTQNFLFQMVGANKTLTPLVEFTKTIPDNSTLVMIGKDLDKAKIIEDLSQVSVA
jgi:G3E family GTPase